MKFSTVSFITWIITMVVMLLLAVHFPEGLVWDNFAAGLIFSIAAVLPAVWAGIIFAEDFNI